MGSYLRLALLAAVLAALGVLASALTRDQPIAFLLAVALGLVCALRLLAGAPTHTAPAAAQPGQCGWGQQ